MMTKIIKVVIELNYDESVLLDTLFPDEELTQEEIIEQVEDMAYEDLTELMRGDRLKYWSEITIVDEYGEEIK